MSSKFAWSLFVALLLLVVLLIKQVSLPQIPNLSSRFNSKTNIAESRKKHHVVRIIDGDTFEIDSNQKVRLIGINAPELCSKKPECYAQESSKYLSDILLGKEIKLEKDVSETDKYGRLLRYVWINDTFVNENLVKNGYANVSSYPPDIKFQEQFLSAQNFARDKSLGMWGDICKK